MSYENGMQFFEKGDSLFRAGAKQEGRKELEKAFNTYMWALEYYMTGFKYCKDPQLKAMRSTAMSAWMSRTETLKQTLKELNPPKKQKMGQAQSNQQKDSDAHLDPETRALRARLMDTIVVRGNNPTTLDDVAGLFQAKRALTEAVSIPLKFPQLFQGKRKPWKGILLYGPPGTGKTYLAQAAASLSEEATYFQVSAADLVSKYVGESERLLRELFRLARERRPAIIFMDEIDALCSTRNSNESTSDAMNRMKTEFLVQMQQIIDTDGVIVIGATNRPFDLDPAVRRRFEKRIYVPLPDLTARETLLTKALKGEKYRFTAKFISELARRTEGWSGADLEILVREACMGPLREATNATLWRKSSAGLLAPADGPSHYYTPLQAKSAWPFAETVEARMNDLVDF